MTKLEQVNTIAKKKGIKEKVLLSTRKGKKYMIVKDGRKIHFGAIGYDDFLDHKDEKRKKNFHNRFKNNKGYNNPNSGLYYSRKLLW